MNLMIALVKYVNVGNVLNNGYKQTVSGNLNCLFILLLQILIDM
jgi:hypothetical protein